MGKSQVFSRKQHLCGTSVHLKQLITPQQCPALVYAMKTETAILQEVPGSILSEATGRMMERRARPLRFQTVNNVHCAPRFADAGVSQTDVCYSVRHFLRNVRSHYLRRPTGCSVSEQSEGGQHTEELGHNILDL
ncbi:unnamed protein product [Dicrocoelium dendriticum]|nr:unnamed protein product [Dicrocoelium dendriticum]